MHRDQSFLYKIRLPLKIIGVIILACLILTGAFFLTKMGPQKIDHSNISKEFDESAGDELLVEIQKQVDQFKVRSEQRAPTEEDFAVLEEAIGGLSNYIEMRGGFHRESIDRREELYKLRDLHRGEVLYEESVEVEKQANSAKLEGDSSKALNLLDRAVYLQRNINENYERSPKRDPRRLTRLEREVEQLTAKPLYEKSLAAEAEAMQLIEEENFGRAKLLLNEAIELQKELNMNFRSLQFADVQRMSRLEQELSSLKSSDIYQRIAEFSDAGEAAEAKGDYAGAAESYQNAYRLQRQLNKDFPQSRFAGVRMVEVLQNKRENALSRDLGEGIRKEMAQMDKAIRERTVWKAVEIIHTLYPKVKQFTEQFPNSTILGKDALLKLQYLDAVEDDIGFLQDRIHKELLAVEGVEDWRMLRTEVSQALYMTVMLKANPSRHVGDLLPVDSGNWDDANSFCQRVSWLLARPVRLPTEAEYYAALGSLRYVDLMEVSWNQENSDGQTHEIRTLKPNSQGFYDLLGNVSEWLQSESLPGEGEAYSAGGSVETAVDDLAKKPVSINNRRMRNRFAGFRIVVNLGKDQ